MMYPRYPARREIIAQLLEVAESYAMDCENISHPEDIANTLTLAIDVAWRTVKPLDADS